MNSVNKLKNETNASMSKPASKGKALLAGVLLSIMAILWGRVIFRKDPVKQAGADVVKAAAAAQAKSKQSQETVKLRYHNLPVIPQRNDVLARDLFVAGKWDPFETQSVQEQADSDEKDSARTDHQKNMEKIKERLKIEAIINNGPDLKKQAYIAGKLVTEGSSLSVTQEPWQYEFRVKKIDSNSVVLKWNDNIITLVMSRSN
jgi:hypothetical protein